MKFFNKTILLANMNQIINIFKDEPIKKPWFPTSIFSEKIVLNHYTIDQRYYCIIDKKNFSKSKDSIVKLNVIRVWKTNAIFDYWYAPFNSRNFIGALDFTIHDDVVKIEYLNLNTNDSVDDTYYENRQFLNHEEALELNSAFIDFMRRIGKQDNKKKIIVDVHNNLRIYKMYYEKEGFVVTSRRAVDNPYWIEVELDISDCEEA